MAARIADSGRETDLPMKKPMPSTPNAISTMATCIRHVMASRTLMFDRSAAPLISPTAFDTASITGSIAEKDSAIALLSSANFRAVSNQAKKSRW